MIPASAVFSVHVT